MELWIRSQDKECLMKINRVDYDLSNGEHRIMVDGYKTLVANYETKEKALEVLDEIEKKLSGIEVTEITNKSGGNMNNIYPIIIYKMPEK